MHRPRLRLGIAAACALAAAGVGVTAAPAGAASTLAIHGADLSTLQRAEDLGAKYYNQNGTQGDPLQILKAAGMNYVRLRVWVNPASGYNNQSKVVAFGKQVKAAGLKLLVDFHYSDTWADPGKQFTPAAWNGHSLSQLETDVYQYTFNVCNALKAAGATPDMVQVGNEINAGMLWPVGKLTGGTGGWSNLAGLLISGYNAVKAVSSSTQVMLHIANGGQHDQAIWWFDEAKAFGVNWDVSGVSYYSYWSGSFAGLQSTQAQSYLNDYQNAYTALQLAAPSQSFVPTTGKLAQVFSNPIENAQRTNVQGAVSDLQQKVSLAYNGAVGSWQHVTGLQSRVGRQIEFRGG